MPDIDLPTVIFALVALFVAWKLRSVLGTRNDGEGPTGLIAPLRRAPGPVSPTVTPPEPAGAISAPAAPQADRWQGFAAPESLAASRPSRPPTAALPRRVS